jgi:hypothetical protein
MNPPLTQRDTRADLRIRKLLGRLSLHAGRVKEALDIYIRLLDEFPQETDVVLIVANLYSISGYRLTAERLYEQVVLSGCRGLLDERQREVVKETAVVEITEKVEAAPLKSPAVERLIERLEALEGHNPERQRIRQAADILESFDCSVRSTGEPGGPVEGCYDQLLPALIDQHLKQARVSNQPELVDVLVSLRLSLQQAMENKES